MIRIGFVPSHRAPFNKEWAIEMKKRTIVSISEKLKDIELVFPDEEMTDGGLLTYQNEVKKVIDLFKEKEVIGIMIGMMTFGEEIPNLLVAEEFSNIPILVFGTKEGPFTETGNRKSDSFCGTISTASGLVRRNIKFEFAGLYFPEEEEFLEDVKKFAKTCFALKNFIGAKVGIIGPRPEPFETCAINEVNLIQKFKNKIVPITLLKLSSDLNKKDSESDKEINKIINSIKEDYSINKVKDETIYKIAKMQYLFEKYTFENNLKGLAVQCWSDMEENIGITPCLSMGRLTDKGIMSACEVDVHGLLTMIIQYYLNLKNVPPHFIDWTIQNQKNENVFLAWHCGNAPISLKCNSCKPKLNNHSILDWVVGEDKSYGTAEFQLREGIVTLSRLVEINNKFKMLITKGKALPSNDELRGSWTWVEVENLKKLYRVIIEEGFTHHASMIFSDISKELIEFCKFADIETVIV